MLWLTHAQLVPKHTDCFHTYANQTMSDTELELKDMEGDEDNKGDDDEDNMEANEDIQSNSEKEESLNNPTENWPRRYI